MNNGHFLGLLAIGVLAACGDSAGDGATTSGGGNGGSTGGGGNGGVTMTTGGMTTGGMTTGGMTGGLGGVGGGGDGGGGNGGGGMGGTGGGGMGGIGGGGMGGIGGMGGMGGIGGMGGMIDPACQPNLGDNQCVSCAKMNCCNELIVCSGDVQCACIVDCVTNGGDTLTCFNMCGGVLAGPTADLLDCQDMAACGCL